jgi:hypothetical protein
MTRQLSAKQLISSCDTKITANNHNIIGKLYIFVSRISLIESKAYSEADDALLISD